MQKGVDVDAEIRRVLYKAARNDARLARRLQRLWDATTHPWYATNVYQIDQFLTVLRMLDHTDAQMPLNIDRLRTDFAAVRGMDAFLREPEPVC